MLGCFCDEKHLSSYVTLIPLNIEQCFNEVTDGFSSLFWIVDNLEKVLLLSILLSGQKLFFQEYLLYSS